MTKEYPQLYFPDRKKWRKWLGNNHCSSNGVFLVYFKKHTGKPSIPYNCAVEEALCFGWIDSIVKRIDDERYMQKFTPRNPKSLWSEINRKRVKKMIDQEKMTEEGMEKIRKAKENGKWFESTDAEKDFVLSDELSILLTTETEAKKVFDGLSRSNKRNYTQWIMSAKKQETQKRRFMKMIGILKGSEKKMPNF